MKRLFFVRHAETEMNAAGLLAGRAETPLTQKGRGQASKAGKDIKEKLPPIDLIICSPYDRTYTTAKLIATEIGYPIDDIQKNDMFIERSFGVLEGTLGTDFLDTHEYREFDEVENAETIEDLQNRATAAFEYVKGLDANNILIVGHGAFGRALRRVVNGLPHTHEYETGTPQRIDNANIVELV
jgi:broad specificity phosphatase PhoE